MRRYRDIQIDYGKNTDYMNSFNKNGDASDKADRSSEKGDKVREFHVDTTFDSVASGEPAEGADTPETAAAPTEPAAAETPESSGAEQE